MLYLFRHGEIESPARGRYFIGQTDYPLNVRGRQQAEDWRQALTKVTFEQVYTSDLRRATETAELITGQRGPKFQIQKTLREIDLGTWDGLAMARVQSSWPEEWLARGREIDTYRPPQGESFADVRERVLPFFQNIFNSSTGHTAVITHAGVIRVVLCHYLGIALEQLFELKQDYGGLNLLERNEAGVQVLFMNRDPLSYQNKSPGSGEPG